MENLIQLIGENEVNLEPEPPEFEALAALILGNAGDDSDGFDALHSEALAGMGEAIAFTNSLDGDMNEAEGNMPELQPGEEVDVLTELAASVAGTNGIIGNLESDMGLTSVPEPTPPAPPPPSGTPGGGGGGSGGGTSGGGTFIGGQAPDLGPIVGSFFPTQRR